MLNVHPTEEISGPALPTLPPKNFRSKACAFCNLEGYLEPFIGSLEYSRNCKINPTSLQVYSGSQTNLGNSKTLNHGPLQCSLESSYGSLHKYLRKC